MKTTRRLAGMVQAKTLKISHVRPQDTAIDKDLRWFSEALDEASGGKIKTKIYPASALGDYTVVQERVGLDKRMRECAWQAVVSNPCTGVTDKDGNGIGDEVEAEK